MSIRTLFIAGTATVLAACSAPAQQQVDRRVATSAGGNVEVHNIAGSVRVVAWDRNEVRVTGTLGRGTERLDLESSGGGNVEVRVVLPRGNGRHDVRGSDIEVRVPAGKSVSVNTVSAGASVSGVNGAVEVRAVSGEVMVEGRPRTVVAESVSGDVTVNATTREVRARSVSGDVNVSGVSGSATGSTVSGDLTVTGSRLSGGFQTVSGDVRLKGDLDRSGTLDVKTHSGEVELALDGSPADVDFSTFSGDVDVDVSGAQVERRSRREQQIRVGRGGSRVTVRTFSGDLRITR